MSKIWTLFIVAILLAMALPNSFASSEQNVVGVYANDIDWNRCLSTPLKFMGLDNVPYQRTVDPYAYDRVIVLGGHMAPTDAHMPTNIADVYLPDHYKYMLIEQYSGFCLVMNIHKPGGQGMVKMFFIAGSDREYTDAMYFGDLDGDGVYNGVEAINDTAYDYCDTDYDNFNDWYETSNADGFYDPLMANDIFLLSYDLLGRQIPDYNDFMYDMISPKQSVIATGGACTQERMAEFFTDLNTDMTDPGRSILYLDFFTVYGTDGFQLADTYMTYQQFDNLLDSLGCIKVVNFGSMQQGPGANLNHFQNGSGKVLSNMDIFRYLYEIQSDGRWHIVDLDDDGYLSLQELIDDYRRNHPEPPIQLKSPLGSDIERILNPGLFQFGVRVSF